MSGTPRFAVTPLRARIVSALAVAAASAALLSAAPSPTATTPTATPMTQPAPVAAPIQSLWSEKAVAQLGDAIRGSAAEGLRPEDYGLSALEQAMAAGRGPALDQAATAAALSLAHDYALGRVTEKRQFGWLIERSAYETADLETRMTDAVRRDDVKHWLTSLLPTDSRYAALRDAYAAAGPDDVATRDRLRVNMERWRWLPRSLGDRYIYVNVPSFRLRIFDGGVQRSAYTVVVGAPKTPTPQLFANAQSVVVNPTWNVPQSIIKSSNLRPGHGNYLWKARAGGYQVIQPAGPRNSLGRIKIDMPNSESIYLHDTPAKSLFARDERAFSHGCIRVQDPDKLAADLLESDDSATNRLDAALTTYNTTTIRMPKSMPVYLVYFTADVGEDGQLTSYGDPYGRDAQLLAVLDGSGRMHEQPAGMTIAAR